MQKTTIGMVGLGRMGANMVRRLIAKGHNCVVWDRDQKLTELLVGEGAQGARDLAHLIEQLPTPRVVWLMVPAAVTSEVAEHVASLLSTGDVLVDGGNSHYRDAVDRSAVLAERGILHVDVGTSGGVHGLSRGYCLMIGGEKRAVQILESVFVALAPGKGSIERTRGIEGEPTTEEQGYLHCGPPGAGHFVKMVHNGIEYGLMAAYAEGFNILKRAGIGLEKVSADAETSPLRDAKYYQYEFELERIAEVWRRGSVVSSWLLDLGAEALRKSPQLTEFDGHVSDSGEGRWTQMAAIDEGVPAHVLSAALFDRFSSRGHADFASQLLSALRFGFGGHQEQKK